MDKIEKPSSLTVRHFMHDYVRMSLQDPTRKQLVSPYVENGNIIGFTFNSDNNKSTPETMADVYSIYKYGKTISGVGIDKEFYNELIILFSSRLKKTLLETFQFKNGPFVTKSGEPFIIINEPLAIAHHRISKNITKYKTK
jgi:hypothetical protein